MTNWAAVDWTRKLSDIAAEIGCHPDSAAKAKSRLGLTRPISPAGLDMVKRKASWKRATQKQYETAKAEGKCLKCQSQPADKGHKTCSKCREKMKATYYARKKAKEA